MSFGKRSCTPWAPVAICFLGIACGGNFAYTVEFGGSVVAQCKNAKPVKLSPANGGFRFLCADGSSVYVIQDTSVNKDGSVVSVDLNKPGAATSYLPAVFSTKRGNEDCPSAKALNRTTGEAAIPTNVMGNPKPGTYQWAMAKPCGNMSFTLARN